MRTACRWRCRTPLPERVATTDLFHDVAKLAVGAGVSFYMLGGAPEALQKAVANVRKLYPGLILVGSRHGYFRPEEEDAIIADIDAARPDILWVAMGAPREQQFAVKNRERLIGVGDR